MSAQNSQTQFFIVATPIGNLGDITLRALEVLKAVDVIACEDTRVTRKLLSHYAIRTRTIAYHEHNGEKMRPEILSLLAAGKRVALVSDAGTPLISDPGYKLAKAVVEAGFSVTSLPGASSVMTALTLAALPTHHFTFLGFLPDKTSAVNTLLATCGALPSTLVIMEAANRLTKTLALLQDRLGNRNAAIARELTKLFEETRRGTLTTLHAHYREQGNPKGEVVIVVEGAPTGVAEVTEDEIDILLTRALASRSLKDAVAEVATATGKKRTDIYRRALALQQP